MAKKSKGKKSVKTATTTRSKGSSSRKRSTKKKSVTKKKGAATTKQPIEGKLTKADFGYSMPLDQPLYPPPPIEYKDTTILTYSYVTDPDAAAAILPAPLCLTETPTVKMVFASYGWSSVGFYNEVVQALSCTYEGQEYVYAVRLHVTTDKAMASGREIGGIPKKIGHIEFSAGAEIRSHLESPLGTRICSAVMIPGQKLDMQLPASNYVSLRVIPDPITPEKPSICELLASVWEFPRGSLWTGVGNFHLDGSSEVDPYHKLPVLKQLQSGIYRGDMTISKITRLKDLR